MFYVALSINYKLNIDWSQRDYFSIFLVILKFNLKKNNDT